MASGKAGKGARKRLLPEREETWELGNGKGQGHPLPTHSFLSPPPPPANTWHGHKQGLCSLPLGQDLVKEAKSRQQSADSKERGGGGLTGLPFLNQGQEGPALWGWQLAALTQQATDTDPLTKQCRCGARGSWHSVFMRGPGVAQLSVVLFLTPSCSALLSILLPTPPLLFLHRYCSQNFRKLKGKNKGSQGASPVQYHLPRSPKTAPEELTPFCPEPSVTS